MEDVVAAKRPEKRAKERTELRLSVEVRRRLGCYAGVRGVSPSEVADDILLRVLPEVPAEYIAATAAVAS